MQKKPSPKPHGAPRLAPRQVRIIGGAWKRALLPVLDAEGLRPTPDRVRETVFNWINHQLPGDWDASAFLDLFAGSGALGFEAASRGAASVTMVDNHGAAARQLEANRDKLKASNVTVLRADALHLARDLAARGQRFDVIFADPPYQLGLLSQVLPLCRPLLKEGGMVYAETGEALPLEGELPDWLAGWDAVRADKAGMVYYYLLKPQASAA
ncbi:16S rRNA (guanine(966)-N(2))-methyltransferase RsmD [Massilia sp. G4R7]|uniref:16S rRNA (Guanine(966)-N(2))-methyltransferase RsmD n=1 Tax=Massilia phyllostachyos TaxID=2898585 RepID=A0ABS8Q7S3_9BURK|nr:16S rRNA (guanine(966)-N(2))-methyltransferase RsmD [Massilia phyllostachyos]MCD2517797.1 16S rRNA (guanine(966)-N(2))-methyltransferase RsmD [Massilia phyllostachyos]